MSAVELKMLMVLINRIKHVSAIVARFTFWTIKCYVGSQIEKVEKASVKMLEFQEVYFAGMFFFQNTDNLLDLQMCYIIIFIFC